MKVCILGNSLTALTLAKTLVNLKINVEVLYIKKNLDFAITRTIGLSKSNIDFFNKKTEIVAISKNHPIEDIEKAISFGVEIFGENRVQEAKLKFEKIKKNIN